MNLPCENCGGKCCGPAPFTKKQYKKLKRDKLIPEGSVKVFVKMGVALVKKSDPMTCAFLTDGRCIVYDLRPYICRAFGEIDDLPCLELNQLKKMAKKPSLIHRGLKLIKGVK